jgi:hypothetical protein
MSKIEDMLASPLVEMRELGKIAKQEKILRAKLHMTEYMVLQTYFPQIMVTGSLALYLHGIRFQRWEWTESAYAKDSDLDIISPSWLDLGAPKYHDFDIEFSAYGRKPETMFDAIYMVKNGKYPTRFKIDFYVSSQRWETITVDGFEYHVSSLEGIWAAKIRCAMNGASKHLEDLQEAMNIQPPRNKDKKAYDIKQREYSSGS